MINIQHQRHQRPINQLETESLPEPTRLQTPIMGSREGGIACDVLDVEDGNNDYIMNI